MLLLVVVVWGRMALVVYSAADVLVGLSLHVFVGSLEEIVKTLSQELVQHYVEGVAEEDALVTQTQIMVVAVGPSSPAK